MTNTAPRLPKWPFFLGDVLLLGLAWSLLLLSATPLGFWQAMACFACVAGGAVLAVSPFYLEHRAALRLSEADHLASTVSQIQKLEQLSAQITGATARWHGVQELSEQAVNRAAEIGDRMTAEAKEFATFMQKANDTEKAHLRLEVEKFQRAENEWLQLTVRLLDHVHALYQAGTRSGQPGLVQQLGQFQNACRDIVRRVGLVPFAPQAHEPFDEKKHQTAEPQNPVPAGAVVKEVIAAGYTFQGQPLRRAVVLLQTPSASEAANSPTEGEPEAQGSLL